MQLTEIYNSEESKKLRVKHHGWPEGLTARYSDESEKEISLLNTNGMFVTSPKDKPDGLWSIVMERRTEKRCAWISDAGLVLLKREDWKPEYPKEYSRAEWLDGEVVVYQ